MATWEKDSSGERRQHGGCVITRYDLRDGAFVLRWVGNESPFLGTQISRMVMRFGKDEATFDADCDATADELDKIAARIETPCCGGCAEVGK